MTPSPETLPRVNISIRNGIEHTETWQEVLNLSQQEPPPRNPTRYMDGGILRKAFSVQTSQLMLVNRGEYGIQVQVRIDQDRPVAALADPSYLTW